MSSQQQQALALAAVFEAATLADQIATSVGALPPPVERGPDEGAVDRWSMRSSFAEPPPVAC